MVKFCSWNHNSSLPHFRNKSCVITYNFSNKIYFNNRLLTLMLVWRCHKLLLTNYEGDNAVKLAAVHRSSGIYLTAEEYSAKPQITKLGCSNVLFSSFWYFGLFPRVTISSPLYTLQLLQLFFGVHKKRLLFSVATVKDHFSKESIKLP